MDESETKYCEPWCAGLASEPRAVGRRLAAVLDALGGVNRNVCQGAVESDCEDLKRTMIEKLRAEGWRVTVGEKWKVLPPK